jgi:hypothetical protein
MLSSLFSLLLIIQTITIPTEQLTNAKVTIIEDEIEIEHIDTSVWSQWVYDYDENGVTYIIFHENGNVSYETKPYTVDNEDTI